MLLYIMVVKIVSQHYCIVHVCSHHLRTILLHSLCSGDLLWYVGIGMLIYAGISVGHVPAAAWLCGCTQT